MLALNAVKLFFVDFVQFSVLVHKMQQTTKELLLTCSTQ